LCRFPCKCQGPAAGVTTKREGVLYIVALCGAAALVTAREARARWPRIALAGVVAGVAAVPWHIWLRIHAVEAESSPPIVRSGGIVGDVVEEPDSILAAIEHVAAKLSSTSGGRAARVCCNFE